MSCSRSFSVIDTATNTVVGSPITVGIEPWGVAVTPDGSKVYVTDLSSNNVSVIDTATNTVVGSPIPVGSQPYGVAVTPDGSKVYVANVGEDTVSVIDTATNTVVGSPITVSSFPAGVAVTPDGSKVYVANQGSNNVAVIPTATNTVTATIPVGMAPIAVGKFIQPLPSFAGTPGQPNCLGVSVSALAQKYGGLSAAAAAFGLAVMDLQNAIGKFCGG
jgi:YVTN family beta-propeller protein